MRVSLSDAKGQLSDLVRYAEVGGEVVLTRHGQAVVRLVPVRPFNKSEARQNFLEAVQKAIVAKANVEPNAAQSQDFIDGDDGLPE